MNIADRIQYLRKQKGYSQEELADKVCLSRQAVSKWESAVSYTHLDVYKRQPMDYGGRQVHGARETNRRSFRG